MMVKNKAVDHLSLLFFVLAIFLIMAFRYRTLNFVPNSLWAEDGPVFFQAAQDSRWWSLFQPYAGYLNIYPRLIAIVSLVLPVGMLPYIFFCGWVSSFLVVRWAVLSVMEERRCSRWVVVILPFLLLMQPHGGETFLSLTNGQWWLAIALAIVCSAPEKFEDKKYGLVVVGLMSVTGPFSILFAPVLLVQAYRGRSLRVAVVVLLGALVQAATLFTHPRVSQSLDNDLGHWAINLAAFFGFGPGSKLVIVAGCVFWVATVFLFISANRLYRSLVVCGVLTYVSTLVSMKGIPAALSPLGGGARYFVIPYAMVTLATVFYVGKSRKAYVLASAALFIVFVFSHNRVYQADLDFSEYANLSKFEPVTKIHLAPFVPDTDGFFVLVRNENPYPSNSVTLQADSSGHMLIARSACADSKGVGVALDAILKSDGYVEIAWEGEEGNKLGSRKVFYRAGAQRIQFAFAKDTVPISMYLVSQAGIELAILGHDKVICF